METKTIRETIEKQIGINHGVLRLCPTWVARDTLPPGKRLGLKEEDYARGERGYICERWLGSETEADNPIPHPGEGLSHLDIEGRDILLRDGTHHCADLILGKEYAKNHRGLGKLCKFFDHATRLFFHAHQPQTEMDKLGRRAKEEAYYFPEGVDMGAHPETFFGVHPYLVRQNRQYETLLPYLERWDSDLILQHSRAYLNVPGDGFHLPSGILHAPGTALTLEIQEPSDVAAVFQARVEGYEIPKTWLSKDIPEEEWRQKGEKAALDQLVWELNGDPLFYENRHTPPIPIPSSDSDSGSEQWIYYNSTKFSGKKLTVKAGHSMVIRDNGVYNLLVWRGEGRIEGIAVEGGNIGMDELLVVHERAVEGVRFENRGREDMVVFKFFGPDINNADVPFLNS